MVGLPHGGRHSVAAWCLPRILVGVAAALAGSIATAIFLSGEEAFTSAEPIAWGMHSAGEPGDAI